MPKLVNLFVNVLSFVIIATSAHGAVIGFDVDDTVLFTSPAFAEGFATAKFGTDEFWSVVNTSDHLSTVKSSVAVVVEEAIKQGHTVVFITARPATDSETLSTILTALYPGTTTIFAPGKGAKVPVLKELGVVAYYGDSDSDIEAAIAAGIVGVRVERAPESSYTKNYNPGKYGEEVLQDSRY